MSEKQIVQRKARLWARDEASERDLSDAEQECLRDLLQSDEVFGQLVTAQQNAVALTSGEDDDLVDVVDHASDAAGELGEAIDIVLDKRVEEAREIVALAEAASELGTWGVFIKLYRAGYTSVEDLQTVSESDLADAGAHPSVAAEIKAYVDDQEVES